MQNKVLIALAATLIVASPLAATAQVDASQDKIQTAIDIAFGATFATNYISRGATQTDDGPAIQGYLEASYGIAYVGVWASNVSFGGATDTEIDVYGGIRPEFDKLSLDFGYAQYIYPKDPTRYGEFYGKASYAVTDWLSPGGEFYYEPFAETTWSVAKVEVSGLPAELAFSARIGTDFGSQALGFNKLAWDAGFSRSFVDDHVTLDVRYHDSNIDPARIMASLSLDGTLASLFGNK
jgi:uncharacterized protein (TIGR02001 family)